MRKMDGEIAVAAIVGNRPRRKMTNQRGAQPPNGGNPHKTGARTGSTYAELSNIVSLDLTKEATCKTDLR